MDLLGILLFFGSFTVIKGSNVCFNCEGVTDLSLCQNTTACTATEICHVKKYATDTNQIHYDVGCLDNSVCDVLTVYCSALRRPGETVLWNRCCNTNYCNIHYDVTGSVSVKTSQTRRCYSCTDIDDPVDCRHIEICEEDETCFTHEHNVNNTITYKMGCLPQLVCEDIGDHLLTGRGPGSSETCRGCCDKDYCNHRYCTARA